MKSERNYQSGVCVLDISVMGQQPIREWEKQENALKRYASIPTTLLYSYENYKMLVNLVKI